MSVILLDPGEGYEYVLRRKARAHVGRREVGSTNNFIIVPKTILVNETIQAEVSAGSLTAADVLGFKKVIKSLVAKSLEITFTAVSDPLK
jgi:hypothetical protein